MTSEPRSFFAIDQGTATTAAALISPVGGRFRLLGAAAAPLGTDREALLEDLAFRVARSDPALSPDPARWPALSRLEVRTAPPPGVCLVALSERTGRDLAIAFEGAGWEARARFEGPHPDPLALGEACLDPRVQAVAMGVAEDADAPERERLAVTWPLVVSIGTLRDDLAVIACGPIAERPDAIPDHRLFALPAPEPVPRGVGSALRGAARQVGAALASEDTQAGRWVDARQALRASIASLAALLDRRVEGLEVGAAAGSRTLAHPDREVRHLVAASGALLAESVLSDDGRIEALLRWTALRGEPGALADRLKDMALAPWRGVDGGSTRLRLAALRAALRRIDEGWSESLERSGVDGTADVVVLSGGAFASVPPAAGALAFADSVRRRGAALVVHDHARLLGPLGALPDESDRRRVLADLMDDALLPLGSVLLTGELRAGARAPRLEVASPLGRLAMELVPDRLGLIELPPGVVGRLEIDPGDGEVLSTRGRRLVLEVSGGLGGLLVDTRDLELRLPDGADGRTVLESWERPIWSGAAA